MCVRKFLFIVIESQMPPTNKYLLKKTCFWRHQSYKSRMHVRTYVIDLYKCSTMYIPRISEETKKITTQYRHT